MFFLFIFFTSFFPRTNSTDIYAFCHGKNEGVQYPLTGKDKWWTSGQVRHAATTCRQGITG
ncbi:MAG: hypothetical protein C4550_07115 [Nitrospiraceae bacterium]|nr:MAG: hypothetical protein C4550_07115 [Nitrospiraceae bacterium]